MEVLPETKLFRKRCSIIWCKDYVYVWKYERFFTSYVYVQLKYCVFEGFFYCYSATYGPIAMKLCMAVKGHLTHVFTNFRKVSSFCLGFIGLWVYVATPTSCKWAN